MPAGAQISPTLFELIASRLGYDRIRPSIPRSPHPIVTVAVVLVAGDFAIQGAKEALGYPAALFVNPLWVIQPALILVGAFGVVYVRKRYAAALEEIDYRNRTANPEQFHRLVPLWVPAGLYVFAFCLRAWGLYSVGLEAIFEVGGVPELLGVTVIMLGYSLIVAEFVAVYLGAMMLVPRRIRRSDFKLDFLDPEGLGGLRPVGELAKTAYYFVVLGLVGFLLMVYGPGILGELFRNPYPDPGIVENAVFTAAWLLTIATMAYGFAQLHLFMKREKRAELHRLNRRTHDVVEDRFDVENLEIIDETTFKDLRQRMEYVDGTREYPTTFAMWSQILISLILPKALQMVLEAV